jgi:hypothetical protein
MKKVIWIAGHGPNRSHDTLYSETFEREKDAKAFVAGQGYWRISRMEYTAPYSPGKRTDEIGGVDVDQEIERIRFAEESRTMRRVSTKQALALWQKSMRSGPGGARKNPARKKSRWDLVFIRSFNAMVIRIQSNAGWSFMVSNFKGATASADPSTGWPQLVLGDPGDPAVAKIFWGTRELAKAHGLKVTTRSTGPFGGSGAYKKLARKSPAR